MLEKSKTYTINLFDDIKGKEGVFKMRGTVIRLIADKGFGFIKELDGEREYFFHRSSVFGFDQIQIGDSVAFEGKDTPKGLRAENVNVEFEKI